MDKFNKTLEILVDNWLWSLIVISMLTGMVVGVARSMNPQQCNYKQLEKRIEALESKFEE